MPASSSPMRSRVSARGRKPGGASVYRFEWLVSKALINSDEHESRRVCHAKSRSRFRRLPCPDCRWGRPALFQPSGFRLRLSLLRGRRSSPGLPRPSSDQPTAFVRRPCVIHSDVIDRARASVKRFRGTSVPTKFLGFPAKPFWVASEDRRKQSRRSIERSDQQWSRSCGRSLVSRTGIIAGLVWWRCASTASLGIA